MEQDAPTKPSASERRRQAHLWLALTVTGAVAAAGVLRAFPPEASNFYPGCPFHAWTGLLCPGCGGTRALAALAQGNLAEALRSNAFVVATLAIAAAWFSTVYARALLEREPAWPRLPPSAIIAALSCAAAFTVVRNMA